MLIANAHATVTTNKYFEIHSQIYKTNNLCTCRPTYTKFEDKIKTVKKADTVYLRRVVLEYYFYKL